MDRRIGPKLRTGRLMIERPIHPNRPIHPSRPYLLLATLLNSLWRRRLGCLGGLGAFAADIAR
jgi:hypothetical protein